MLLEQDEGACELNQALVEPGCRRVPQLKPAGFQEVVGFVESPFIKANQKAD